MRITRAGVGLLASGVIAVAIGLIFGIVELFLLTAMCLAAFILAVVAILTGSPGIDISRQSRPFKLRAFTEGEIVLTLSNKGQRPTSVIQALDSIQGGNSAKVTIASLPPKGTIKMSYRAPNLRRGVLKVGPMKLLTQDPLGLVKKAAKTESVTEFLVRPHLTELDPIAAAEGTLRATQRRTRSKKSGDDEFYALRPYVLGDDLRKVNWRAAAKSDDLLVKQERKTELGAVTIVLDTAAAGYDPNGFERAVSAACSVLHAAFAGDDLVKFYVSNSPTVQTIDTQQSLESAEKSLSLMKPSTATNVGKILESLSQRSPGGTLITIFGNPTSELASAVEKCKFRHKRTVSICCNPTPNLKWAIPYDGNTPLQLVWNRGLAVSKS